MPDRKPRPLKGAEVEKQISAQDAKSQDLTSITKRFFVAAGAEPPRLAAKAVPLKDPHGREEIHHYEILLEINGVKVGERAFASPIPGKGFKQGLPRSSDETKRELLAAFVPDHLPLLPVPKNIVKARRLTLKADEVKRPTTIFPPDNRRIFRDTAYPWSTVGLVQTPHGTGSGVMIGPRHLLTVSHVIDWNVQPPYAANWVKFTPSYYDGSEPFGHSYSTNIYWFNKDSGDNTIDQTEEQYDYVVVVLDSRIGESTGWMGARGYSDSWDGLEAWSHMGYPGDLNNGQRPSWQGWFSVDGSSSEPDAHEAIMHKADVWPGQSGGPVFGWWDGDVGPRAVATQSWQTSSTNGASGGDDLDELVIHARTDFP